MSGSQCPDEKKPVEFVETGMPDMRGSLREELRAPERLAKSEIIAMERGVPFPIPEEMREAFKEWPKTLSEAHAQIHAERGARYGEGTQAHTNLGLIWTGILQNHFLMTLPAPIPADVVLLMMAANKLNRAACPTPLHGDNYDDGVIYVEMAREAKKG